MEFTQTETAFYLAVFIAGACGNIARQLRVGDVFSLRIWSGRTLAAGFFGAGGCACWLGSSLGSGHTSGYLLVFASAIAGYMFVDLEQVVIAGVLSWFKDKFFGGKN